MIVVPPSTLFACSVCFMSSCVEHTYRMTSKSTRILNLNSYMYKLRLEYESTHNMKRIMKWKYFHLSIFFIPSLPYSSFSFHLKFVCVCLNTIWSSLLLFSFFSFWGYVFRSRSHTSIKQTNRLYSSKITSQSFKYKTLNNRHNISKLLLMLENDLYTTNKRKISFYSI